MSSAGLRHLGTAGKLGWIALIVLIWAACSGEAIVDGAGGSVASSASSGQGGSTGSCEERILPVVCNALPPDCPDGKFPASDGSCWTGACLDCIDGCQSDSDCVVVRACGCFYHEGCSWAETSFRAELLDPCVVTSDQTCTGDCSQAFCDGTSCPWCDADGAECIDGTCRDVVNHMCA